MENKKQQQANRARERRLRAKYRRNLRTAIILCLIIGLAGGFVLGQYAPALLKKPAADRSAAYPTAVPTASSNTLTIVTQAPTAVPTDEPTAEPTAAPTAVPTDEPTAEPTAVPTAEPTDEPTAEPTAEPTVEPTAEPTPVVTAAPKEIIVPFGETRVVSAQINNDGSVRKNTDTLTYETVNFAITVNRYLTPEYYMATYASRYQMHGDEAGVEFEMMLSDYMGSQTIAPQDLLDIALVNADGVIEQGYQLTDAEIQGSRVVLTTNIPTETYKRFRFSNSLGDMKYLRISAVVDGVTTEYLFELGDPIRPTPEPTAEPTPVAPTPEPTAEPTYEKLEVTSRGDAVKQLQQKLIDLGYLEGTADGRFGEMTAKAVKAAQADFGMTVNGVADKAFQKRLYSEN